MLKGSVRCLSTSLFSPPPSRGVSNKTCYEWGNVPTSWGFQKLRTSITSLGAKERKGVRKEALVPTLTEPPLGETIKSLAYGSHHAARLMNSGAVYVDGDGSFGELGLGESVKRAAHPQKVNGLPKVKQVECGDSHTLALTEDGKVYSWGDGGSFWRGTGALGHGNKNTIFNPKLIEDLPPISQIASGQRHCLALAENGELFSWGAGAHGVLGTGSSKDLTTPKRVALSADIKVRKIGCGMNFSGVLSTNGTVHLWGRNDQHQLASSPGIVLDMNAMEALPMLVEYLVQSNVKVVDFALGSHHTLVCTEDKQVWMWGRKFPQPELFVDAKDIVQVAAGNDFSVAVDRFGHLFTWGDGSGGCLGNGDTAYVNRPQPVSGFGPTKAGHNFGAVEKVFAGGKNVGVITNR